MIITSDLRLAIRSAQKRQKITTLDWSERQRQEQLAVDKLVAAKPTLKKALAQHKKAAAECEKANIIIAEYGLYATGTSRIRDTAKFLAAGGQLPAQPAKAWTFDDAIAELAAADSKDAQRILKRYGINWS